MLSPSSTPFYLRRPFFISELFGSSNNHASPSDMEEQLPQDLITEILQLLPAKTLLRFRCISKSLCGIIDSPDFIKSHLAVTSKNRTHGQDYRPFNPVPIHVLDMDEPFPPELHEGNGVDITYLARLPDVFAQCNGLVLFFEGHLELVVWNPSTRKCRKLPDLPSRIEAWGFGYDSSIDDYKVLVILSDGIWILGFRSSHWRRIECPDDFCYHRKLCRICFVDGAFHYLSVSNEMFVFDLAKETFSKVSLPVLALEKETGFGFGLMGEKECLDLQVVEGCLCFSLFRPNQYWELYARKRKNDGGELCWTKLFCIRYEQLPGISFREFFIWGNELILGFPKNGDKIYVLYDQCALYSYDFKENNMKMILAGDKHTQKVFPCIDSLV
ncbi:F-box protein CPR1-like [Euphorbia lathyris]|uniref:F-box protein CPR1-like n=1 Tax=Euphorbia lathyris TaxID=212925 RepID=UPI0033130E18